MKLCLRHSYQEQHLGSITIVSCSVCGVPKHTYFRLTTPDIFDMGLNVEHLSAVTKAMMQEKELEKYHFMPGAKKAIYDPGETKLVINHGVFKDRESLGDAKHFIHREGEGPSWWHVLFTRRYSGTALFPYYNLRVTLDMRRCRICEYHEIISTERFSELKPKVIKEIRTHIIKEKTEKQKEEEEERLEKATNKVARAQTGPAPKTEAESLQRVKDLGPKEYGGPEGEWIGDQSDPFNLGDDSDEKPK